MREEERANQDFRENRNRSGSTSELDSHTELMIERDERPGTSIGTSQSTPNMLLLKEKPDNEFGPISQRLNKSRKGARSGACYDRWGSSGSLHDFASHTHLTSNISATVHLIPNTVFA